MFIRFSALLITLAFSLSALAAELGAATFSDTHVRPTAGKVGVGFFTVTTAKNDAITSLASDCCKAVELHRNEKMNGVMAMRRIATLSLKKGEPFLVQPKAAHGEHLMLIGLKQPLVAGDTVDVTFTFEEAGKQTVTFPVQSSDAASGDAHAHH